MLKIIGERSYSLTRHRLYKGKTGKFMFGGKIIKNGFLGVLVNTVTPTPMSERVSWFGGALHTTM